MTTKITERINELKKEIKNLERINKYNYTDFYRCPKCIIDYINPLYKKCPNCKTKTKRVWIRNPDVCKTIMEKEAELKGINFALDMMKEEYIDKESFRDILFKLASKMGGVRNLLLALGDFKDVPLLDELGEQK